MAEQPTAVDRGAAVTPTLTGFDARELRFLSVAVIAAAAVLFAFSIHSAATGASVFHRDAGNDFLQFYAAGKTLNEHGGEILYDVGFQQRLLRSLAAKGSTDVTFVFAYPPFVAALCRPFARLPYAWAYALWVLASVLCYAAGLLLLCTVRFGHAWRTPALLAFSFCPFLLECCVGGQIAAIAFLALALAVELERSGRFVLSGMAIGICLYKPTLLILLIPMLLMTRRWRALGGAVLAGGILAATSVWVVGIAGLLAYFRVLGFYGGMAAGGGSPLRTFKYIDLNSFARLLAPAAYSSWGRMVAAAFAAVALGYLGRWWWSRRGNPESRDLVWAVTVLWTLVLNVYVPIYDATLAAAAALLVGGYIYAHNPPAVMERFNQLAAALYLLAWITQACAAVFGLQVLTVALVAMALFSMRLHVKRGRADVDVAGADSSRQRPPEPAVH